MFRQSKLISPARKALSLLSRSDGYHSLSLSRSSSCTGTIRRRENAVACILSRPSSKQAMTAYEITNSELYRQWKKDTTLRDRNLESLFVLMYPGCRVLTLYSPESTEDYHVTSRVEGNDVLDYEIAAATIREQNMNIGGNVISLDIATRIKERMDAYKINTAVSIVFFASKSLDLFSGGLFSDIEAEPDDIADIAYWHRLKSDIQLINERKDRGLDYSNLHEEHEMNRLRRTNDVIKFIPDYMASVTATQLRAINELAASVASHNKITVAVFGGLVAGTAYSAFGASKYKLASSVTSFYIPELARGLIPVGGLAYHLSNSCDEGVAVARYLAVSEHSLRANEMHAIGMITHIVEEAPYDTIGNTISHTICDDPMDGLHNVIVPEALEDLLETMHISSDIDICDSPLWKKLLLVPFDETPLTYRDEATGKDVPFEDFRSKDDLTPLREGPANDLDFLGHIDLIQQCFSPESPAECLQNLHALKSTWGDSTAKKLENLLKNESESLTFWYSLTRMSRSEPIEIIMEKEIEMNIELGVRG